MEQQLKYEEWFFQSDYDLETAQFMLQSGRNIYCIFMCHLSLEKALKGLFIKRLNQHPPELNDLICFVEKLKLKLEKEQEDFLIWLNKMADTTCYPEDLRDMLKMFPSKQTDDILRQTKSIQQWIMQQ